jgi:hypothetical protein
VIRSKGSQLVWAPISKHHHVCVRVAPLKEGHSAIAGKRLFLPHSGPPSPAPGSTELVESGPSHLLCFVQLRVESGRQGMVCR